MLTMVGSAPFTILLLSAVWLLMSFLMLQLIANPTVFVTVVGTIAQTGGLVILAVVSILAWLGASGVRPLHRIGAMLSIAALQQTRSPDQRPPRDHRTGPLAAAVEVRVHQRCYAALPSETGGRTTTPALRLRLEFAISDVAPS